MENYFKSLIDILERQLVLAGRLIELGNAETEALQHNNLQSLKAVLEFQQEPVEQVNCLEQDRLKLQQLIEEQLNIKEITFKQVLQYAGDTKETLRTTGTSLAARLQELQEINETNRLLIEQSIRIETVIMNALTGIKDSYNQKGQKVRTSAINATSLNRSV